MRTEEILHNTRIYEIEDQRDAVSELWYIRKPNIFEDIIDFFRNLFTIKKPF